MTEIKTPYMCCGTGTTYCTGMVKSARRVHRDAPSAAVQLFMGTILNVCNTVQVIERANIHDVKGKVLVEFNESQGTFDFPRGRYSVEMYSHFMRMHGSR